MFENLKYTGRKGHFVNNCCAQTHANGTCLDDSDSDDEILSCYRCGRDGHFANGCYAKRDIYGRPIFFKFPACKKIV